MQLLHQRLHPHHTQLEQLLAASHTSSHGLADDLCSPQHTAECACKAIGASDADEQTRVCQGVECCIQTITAWAAAITSSINSTTNNSTPAQPVVPQQHCIMLLRALHDTRTTTSANNIGSTSALHSSCKALTAVVLQLCWAAEAAAVAAAAASMQPDAAPTPAHPGPPDQQQQPQPPCPTQPAAAEALARFKAHLLWSCHLTTSLHKFICSAEPTTATSASNSRRKAAAPLPPSADPATASTTTTTSTSHKLPTQLQQYWLQKGLPAALQHLLACYSHLNGVSSSSSSNTSDSAGLLQVLSASVPAAATAVASSPLSAVLGSAGCRLPLSTKQQASADQLLHGTCLAILTSTASSNTSTASTTTPKKASNKPPAKQPRKTAAAASSSNNKGDSKAVSLTPQCLQLLADMFGSHLLFRHMQQLLQQLKQALQARHSPSSSGPNPSSWQWAEEAARILSDPQQAHLHPLLPQALASLLHNPNTCSAACSMMCAAAGAICLSSPGIQQVQPQGRQSAAAKTRNAPSAAAAAASVINNQSGLVLLELLANTLTAQWPSAWAAPAYAAPTAAAACSGNGLPGTATSAAASTAVTALKPAALQQLVAAAVLPVLQPVVCQGAGTAAAGAGGVGAGAARKLCLNIAAVAAAPSCLPSVHSAAAAGGGADQQRQAASACRGQVAALLVLAAAAHGDRDATVRARALGLLQQAAPSFLKAWQCWSHLSAQQKHEQQLQQAQDEQAAGEGTAPAAAAAAGAPSTSSPDCKPASSTPQPSATPPATAPPTVAQTAAEGLRTAAAAIIAALSSQLLGSSKSCRLKALQLLQQLLQPARPLHRGSKSGPSHAAATAAETAAAICRVKQLQQQLVCITFPSTCSILAAGQDSPLYCPNCKTAAEALVPAMAAVLQPQQALQLALSYSNTTSGSSSCAMRTVGLSAGSRQEQLRAVGQQQGQQQQQEEGQDKEHVCQDPGALLLAPLASCSAPQLYELLRQQLVTAKAACSTDCGVGGACAELCHQAAPSAAPSATAASDTTAGAAGSEYRAAEVPAAQRQLLHQMQQLVGGLRGREGLRRHAFVQACQALMQALDAATAASTGADAGAETTPLSAAAGGASIDTQQQQEQLLQAMQLLRVCGGCGSISISNGSSSNKSSSGDLRAELAILIDCLDLCCMWLEEASTAAGAASAGGGGGGGAAACASVAVPQELLRTIVCILDTAYDATAAAAAAAAFTASAASADGGQPAPGSSSSVWCSTWMWGDVAACLLHHLEAVVSYSCAGAGGCEGGGGAATILPLPVSTLDVYIKVLCNTNRSQQLLLHELLCSWHKQLADDGAPGPAAAAMSPTPPAAGVGRQHTANNRLAPFLLLVKHLSGFYAVERAVFRQQVADAMKASRGAAAAGDGGAAGAAAAADGSAAAGQQQQQEQQVFDYMLGEEEAACVEASTARFTANLLSETAPACYLPLLLQLVGAAAAPCHVRVLALQALEPLLLVSGELSSSHSSSLALLLSDTRAPAALLLQAVSTAGRLIMTRPAESSLLVQQLEQLLLATLRDSETQQAAGGETGSLGGAGAGSSHSVRQHGQRGNAAADTDAQQQLSSSGGCAAAAIVAAAAARWYCQLLLSEKLLLTGASWGVVAEGLLAFSSVGPLETVGSCMRQLIQALLQHQRMPRSKVAIDLLLNCPPRPSQQQQQQQLCRAADVTAFSCVHGGSSSRNTPSSQPPGAHASALVQQLLLHVLTPKDLAAESLTLPLLQAVTLAVSSGWGGGGGEGRERLCNSGSAGEGQEHTLAAERGEGSIGGAAESSAVAAAALLAECTPTGRCLEMLLRACQAHKHTMALHCGSSLLSQLAAFVAHFNSSNSSGTGAAKASAAPAQHTAMQQSLLRLLESMQAAAGAAELPPAAAAAGGDDDDDDDAGPVDVGGGIAAWSSKKGATRQQPAAGKTTAGVKRVREASEVCDAQRLQQLLQERQKDVLQLKQLQRY